MYKSKEKSFLENSLKDAIKNNELIVYYQPKVCIKTGKITGMEALVRWIHPKYGIISPEIFIPIAEENELIVPIGELVLKEACITTKRLHDLGYKELDVAVNISAIQLKKTNLQQLVIQTLSETGLEAKFLELEITESIAITNITKINPTFKTLKDLGIKITLDDFGTGYSSLRYLKEIYLNNLKIDRDFIKDLTTNNKNKIIASAIIDIAHKLNFGVIAEGIETLQQYEILAKNNCDYVQGFLFSKPVPNDEFEQILSKHKFSDYII